MKVERCEVCNFPLVDKHHLIPQSEYGDYGPIVLLCPNCHRLFHLIYNKVVADSKTDKLGHVILAIGLRTERLRKLYDLVYKAQALEAEEAKRVIEYIKGRRGND